jgi:hypothetical protein
VCEREARLAALPGSRRAGSRARLPLRRQPPLGHLRGAVPGVDPYPPAYLLAADHATPGMRDLASGVREQGRDLFADNGNFELIGKTEARFRDCREVLQKVRTAADLPTRGGAR